MTVPIKKVVLLNELTGTGIVAIDRIRNLTWKDYKPIAKGEDVIQPHAGNVDTFQGEINSMMYNSQEIPDTDLARMKNEPLYRAQLTASMARTLAATFFLRKKYRRLWSIRTLSSGSGRKEECYHRNESS